MTPRMSPSLNLQHVGTKRGTSQQAENEGEGGRNRLASSDVEQARQLQHQLESLLLLRTLSSCQSETMRQGGRTAKSSQSSWRTVDIIHHFASSLCLSSALNCSLHLSILSGHSARIGSNLCIWSILRMSDSICYVMNLVA